MKTIKKFISVFFSAILLISALTTSSIAIDKIHFVIGGGAGGGWDGTARGTGEALTKAGMLKSCLLYTSPSPRDLSTSRMPSSA